MAFILPKNFAYGFREPLDKIWSLWEVESIPEVSGELCIELNRLMNKYDKDLDIIYDDNLEFDSTHVKYYFWNGKVIES